MEVIKSSDLVNVSTGDTCSPVWLKIAEKSWLWGAIIYEVLRLSNSKFPFEDVCYLTRCPTIRLPSVWICGNEESLFCPCWEDKICALGGRTSMRAAPQLQIFLSFSNDWGYRAHSRYKRYLNHMGFSNSCSLRNSESIGLRCEGDISFHSWNWQRCLGELLGCLLRRFRPQGFTFRVSGIQSFVSRNIY